MKRIRMNPHERWLFSLVLMVVLACAPPPAKARNGVILAGARGGELVLVDERVLLMTPWYVDGESEDGLLCVYHEALAGVAKGKRTLSIYAQREGTFKEIFREDAIDEPGIALFQDRDDGGDLVFVTETIYYHCVIYAYVNGKIERIFGDGAKAMPQFVRCANGQQVWILAESKGGETWKVYERRPDGYALVREAKLSKCDG